VFEEGALHAVGLLECEGKGKVMMYATVKVFHKAVDGDDVIVSLEMPIEMWANVISQEMSPPLVDFDSRLILHGFELKVNVEPWIES
jgi:hypothetical protein